MSICPLPRPQSPPPVADAIPQCLTRRPQWSNWRWEFTGSKWDKSEYFTPGTEQIAKTNDPTTLGTFEAAMAGVLRGDYDGIVYVTTPDDGYLFLDCDAAIDEYGQLDPWAWRVAQMVGGYVERSVTDGGIHVFAPCRERIWTPARGEKGCSKKAPVPEGTERRGKKPEIEYIWGHHNVIMTGRIIPELCTKLVDRTEAFRKVWGLYSPRSAAPASASTSSSPNSPARAETAPERTTVSGLPPLTDDEIVQRCRTRGTPEMQAEFERLYTTVPAAPSLSEPHYELCKRILYWTMDEQQAIRIVAATPLARARAEKWGKDKTPSEVRRANGKMTKRWDPNYRSAAPGPTGGPLAWTRLMPEAVDAMSVEQLKAALLERDGWLQDVVGTVTQKGMKAEARVIGVCAHLVTDRTPSLHQDTPPVRTTRQAIARLAGVNESTVSRTVAHLVETGTITYELRTAPNGTYREIWVGAGKIPTPDKAVGPNQVRTEEAGRAKERRRKECQHCGCSAVVTTGICAGCGAKVKERVTGDDKGLVKETKRLLKERNRRANWRPQDNALVECDPKPEPEPQIPYGHLEPYLLDHLVLIEDVATPKSKVFKDYYAYCRATKEEPVSKETMARFLAEKGVTETKDAFCGVAVIQQKTAQDAESAQEGDAPQDAESAQEWEAAQQGAPPPQPETLPQFAEPAPQNHACAQSAQVRTHSSSSSRAPNAHALSVAPSAAEVSLGADSALEPPSPTVELWRPPCLTCGQTDGLVTDASGITRCVSCHPRQRRPRQGEKEGCAVPAVRASAQPASAGEAYG